ncbi:MAG: hypothetical protein FWH19_01940 [Treponema sp.]|nr:hypothetical protein [Treponema sp.]
MKRKILFVLMIAALVATASAQGRERGERQRPDGTERQARPQRPPAETVSLAGSLIVAQGMPALQSGNDTYLIFGLGRLIGFIDGLREGAQVTIDGTVVASPMDSEIKILVPSQLALGGRTYDIRPPTEAFGQGPRWHMRGDDRSHYRNPPRRLHRNTL